MPLQSLLTKPPAAVEAEAGLMADFWFLVCVGLSDLLLNNILAGGGCVPKGWLASHSR